MPPPFGVSCALDALIDDPFAVPGSGPLLMGGFSFDPQRPAMPLWEGYPDGLLVLPRYVLTSADGAAWLTINTVFEPDSTLDAEADIVARIYELFDGEPLAANLSPVGGIRHGEDVMPAEQWKAIVRQVEQNMRRGDLGKVVLARQYRVEGRAVFDPALVVDRLRADYADCFVFAVARGDRCFLGASPERLVRLRDRSRPRDMPGRLDRAWRDSRAGSAPGRGAAVERQGSRRARVRGARDLRLRWRMCAASSYRPARFR